MLVKCAILECLDWKHCIASAFNYLSFQDSELMKKGHELYDKLQSQLPDDVILEDRLHLSIGRRLRYIELLGYPITIVLGKKVRIHESIYLLVKVM